MAYRQCQITLLKQEISNKKRNSRTLKRDLTSVKNELSLKLSFIDLNQFIGNDKAILKHKQIQNKKLNNLRVTTSENCSHDPDKLIYNFSDYKLTDSEKSVLCKDLEFSILPSKLEYVDFMLPFELLFCDIKSTDLSIPQTKAVKLKILDTAFPSFDSLKVLMKIKSNLSKEELKALHNLHKQKHLVVKKAYKGNTVVITEKNCYGIRLFHMLCSMCVQNAFWALLNTVQSTANLLHERQSGVGCVSKFSVILVKV